MLRHVEKPVRFLKSLVTKTEASKASLVFVLSSCTVMMLQVLVRRLVVRELLLMFVMKTRACKSQLVFITHSLNDGTRLNEVLEIY